MENNICEHVIDTLVHKKYVLESSINLIKYLFETNRQEEAIELAKRCSVHDMSKFSEDEMFPFSTLPPEKETLKNPKKALSDDIVNVIKIHWKNKDNSHHPENHNHYSEMSEIDIMEMVCDWNARSLQYNTNLLEFVEIRQKTRFNFDETFYEKVLKYCNIILYGKEKLC